MAIKIKNTTVIDDDRNITNAITYNGYVPASQAITITAGNGLSGGGNLTANRTLTVVTGNGLGVNSTAVFLNAGDGIVANTTGTHVDSTVVRTTGNQTITGIKTFSTTQLSLSNSGASSIFLNFQSSLVARWFVGKDATSESGSNAGSDFFIRRYDDAGVNLGDALVITRSTGRVTIADGSGIANLSAANITGTISTGILPSTIVYNSRSIISGNGLSGGGNLSADRTLTIGAANGISVYTTSVGVNAGNGLLANTTGVHVIPGNGLGANSTTVFVGAGDGIAVYNSSVGVNAGNGIVANTTGVHVDSTVVRTTGNQTIEGNKLFINNSTNFQNATSAPTQLVLRNATSNRWAIGRSSTPETGSDAGSVFQIIRYNDAGGSLGVALTIVRSTGVVNIPNGAGITNLSANNILTGTLDDARVSSNIMTLNTQQTATASKNFTAGIVVGSALGEGVLTLAGNKIESFPTTSVFEINSNYNINISANNEMLMSSANNISINTSNGHIGLRAGNPSNYKNVSMVANDVNIQANNVIFYPNTNIMYEKTNNSQYFVMVSTANNAIMRMSHTYDNAFISFRNGTNATIGSISMSGSNTVYATSSDYRLKENVRDLPTEYAINKLKEIQPRVFDFINGAKDSEGFIAHELAEIYPGAVIGTKDAIDEEGNPIYQGVESSRLIPILVASLKSAINRIEILEKKLKDMDEE